MSSYESGDTSEIPPQQQQPTSESGEQPLRFRGMLRRSDALQLPVNRPAPSQEVFMPPPPERRDTPQPETVDVPWEAPIPEPPESAALDVSHPVMGRWAVTDQLRSRRHSPRAVGSLFQNLVANAAMAVQGGEPLPFSEQPAYAIENRQQALETVISLPNLAAHADRLEGIDDLSPPQRAAARTLIADYEASLPARAAAIATRPLPSPEASDTVTEPQLPPEPVVEHHRVFDRNQLNRFIELRGRPPQVAGLLMNNLMDSADLQTFHDDPVPYSEHIGYTITNRQGQRESVLSLPNLAAHIKRVTKLPNLGEQQRKFVRQLVTRYTTGKLAAFSPHAPASKPPTRQPKQER